MSGQPQIRSGHAGRELDSTNGDIGFGVLGQGRLDQVFFAVKCLCIRAHYAFF
jgi:hypothetical protein